jgi:hypothetical protein
MNTLKSLIPILLAFTMLMLASCKKDEVNDPTGTYNVNDTYHGTSGTLIIIPFNDKYNLTYSYSLNMADCKATITNGQVSINQTTGQGSQTRITTGTGTITNEGFLNLSVTTKFGQTYKFLLTGQRVK